MSHKFLYVFFVLVLLFLLGMSLLTGPASLSALDIFSKTLSAESQFVLTELRIPRTMALFTIGASLALCGVILQTLLSNPLSEPFTLGLSGASTLGAVLFLFLGIFPSWLSLPLGSLLGSASAMIFILYLQKKIPMKSNVLILSGVMISFFSGAVVTLIISIMDPYQMQQAIYWMMGLVGTPRDAWSYYLLPIFIGVLSFFYYQKIHLDRLLLGLETAQNLGTRVKFLKYNIIFLSSLLCSLCVSISGLVGFVGLVAPHLCYFLFKTRRHRVTLLAAPLLGAILFLISDIVSRSISTETEIPAGSLMALMGAPLLILFLIRGTKRVSNS